MQPNPPLYGQPLAEEIYGPKAIPADTETQGARPVGKEAAGDGGAGITAGTGLFSYDLEGRSDDEEPDEAAQVAKEMAVFRRFERARRRSGEWRDFEFRVVDPVCGHQLNDAGRQAVAKAGGSSALPKAGDPDDWTGIWARTHERRTKLLATHEKAVLAAWNDLTANLSPRTLVREFREDIGQVAKLADPDRPWWKDRGKDAALAWLLTLEQRKGWAALIAAIEDAIRDGMAEGEADSLAVAADRQGVKDFSVAAAFTAAAQALQGDPQVSQRAQETAQAILAGTAAALSVTLADGAANGSSEAEMADAVSADITGPDVSPVRSWLANALWTAAGAGLTGLIGQLLTGSPARTTPETGPEGPPSPPPEPPEPGLALINWVCEGGNPCVTCLDNQGGSPYAPDDVPQYLATITAVRSVPGI